MRRRRVCVGVISVRGRARAHGRSVGVMYTSCEDILLSFHPSCRAPDTFGLMAWAVSVYMHFITDPMRDKTIEISVKNIAL